MTNKRILTLVFVVAFLTLLVGCLPQPTNQAPIITSIPITAVELGETYTYDVNATDPEGDTLTYSLITKPTGMTITSATGLIKWIPATKGNYTVAVKVSDGVLYIIQSFTIVVSKLPDPPAPPPVVNYAPIITSIPGNTAIIGVTYLYDVNATDPDGDTLTYSLTTKPPGMVINPANGLISWIPTSVQTGYSWVVIVSVSDGTLSDFQGFNIVVSEPEPDPEIELTGITVDPKTMTLFVGESEAIKSVTATYEIKGFEALIPLGDCDYVSDPTGVVTISDVGLVTAVKADTATITVTYKGETDKITVTVSEPVVKTITIRWLEDAIRYNLEDEVTNSWFNNPIPGVGDNKPAPYPATLTLTGDGGYYFANVNEYFNWDMEYGGSIVINGTGQLSGYATYTSTASGLPIEDHFEGDVKIIFGETINWSEVVPLPVEIPYDYDGIMVGTYTQQSYAYAKSDDEVAMAELLDHYPGAILAPEIDPNWWFIGHTDYIAHGGK